MTLQVKFAFIIVISCMAWLAFTTSGETQNMAIAVLELIAIVAITK